MRLNILHTNDIHSNFDNFAKAVSKINELKDENTLVLDAGDYADFKRMELQGTNGLAAVELLEAAGYDAIAIGNNEFFNGVDTLNYMATNSKVPFLTCNLYTLDNKDILGANKSIILEKNNIKILLIGAAPDIAPFNELCGFKLKNYIEVINEELEINNGKYDICILLSHLGMDKDREVAEKIEKVNVIIGGHFHILMNEPEVVNNTIIFTSGCFAEHLGVLKLEVDSNGVKLIDGENIAIEKCDQDAEINRVLKVNKEKAIDVLGKPLYEINEDLWHDIVEENPMTNFLADALADVLKCDLSLINSGVLNGGIRKGAVSLKKLLEICPSPLNPTSFEVQGKHLKEALQNSLDTDYCYLDGKGPGFRGKYLGRLHVSRAFIEHDGRTITNVFINGEMLEEERWYTVAASDYLLRGTGYTSLSNNRNEKYNPEYLRDTLKEYLTKEDFVKGAFVDRWRKK
ncbi:bifunctional metallophosphatase/5'-nucleotidase [Clostridium manihotivorum]|uniref:Bifunctional metallophosphatase/5'-nucleotidase n=1 Tax=Clostridium manihotivorum TaxID=2320868 RepID=A0A410DWL0_9CLOT|nr:bifunctional UDP-sugar hydrolase/5'-nucleotidase [Clostridium manihotivorum]QAA33465.1 bifunctional metallophosphatase/5'-nucleotidase [Clostridium manihotivorum]